METETVEDKRLAKLKEEQDTLATEKRALLKHLFKIADYDYKDCKSATVSRQGETTCYDLLPMLDTKKDIEKVIKDIEHRGFYITPF